MTMRLPNGVKAVFFDMDGTLIDSEPLTDAVVAAVIRDFGLPPPGFSYSELHGKTWNGIENELVLAYPALDGKPLAERMQRDFDARMRSRMPRPIRGAVRAFIDSSRSRITGIVSSSPRATIGFVAKTLGLATACKVLVGAENVQQSKPHPECYLGAASYARVRPSDCLVFEDSVAGLTAARAAGMITVAVVGTGDDSGAATLADCVVANYRELPRGYFAGPEGSA
jgi:HAD superfamily hydrolase (TIGR01509 family)